MKRSMKQILTLLFVQLYMHTITRKMTSFYIFFSKSRWSPYMHAADAHKKWEYFQSCLHTCTGLMIQYPTTAHT
jgi:hypothetical protein